MERKILSESFAILVYSHSVKELELLMQSDWKEIVNETLRCNIKP